MQPISMHPSTHHEGETSDERPDNTALVVSGTLLGATTFTLGALYPPDPLLFISPRSAAGPPDPSSQLAITLTNSLESSLHSLPYLQKLRNRADADEWYETRPFVNYPEERKVNSLTQGALRGAGKLALYPLVRARKDEKEAIVIVHVGRGVCGHEGIVHGGLLATILDESLARVAFQHLPNNLGVTANLNINYKAATKADQFIVIHTKLESAKGRKAVVSGEITDLDGKLLVDASAVFVEPKYAKYLNTNAIKEALGEPTHAPILPGSGAPIPIPPSATPAQSS
ncbi:Thioesterase/thiol ester dehydrase-isomerase [Sistotremastrum suecicum HHB10207 ss-3]|uniref:Thioesterase/thiol ester dehydrase-isomerase n=1 Tax=Sistotremastrum suecicum HHB10207 ss-3 TaxID=1314776 RepID=A0A166DIX0_9AGAM|nr:Thioesterase/thiol ester dehydrase-isomerase [Sistotremastrum suecicum HHB10207 ss-3]